MDVTNEEQAKIAEESGAVAVIGLERVQLISGRSVVCAHGRSRKNFKYYRRVSIPVMAKCRIGHFAEARILEALGVDYIDESEVLTPADEDFPHQQA